MPLALSRELICRGSALAADPRRHFRHSEHSALFPGGGEDRYGRGGPSKGRFSCRQPRIDGGVGRPGFEDPDRPRPAVPVPGERPACGQRVGGDVPTGSQVSGVVVQIRGGSMIFGPLTSELACSAVLAHALVGRRGRAVRACGGAVAQQVGSFVGSCVVEVYLKKFYYQ